MTLELRSTASRWLAADVAAIVVEISKTAGSVPRERGTRMLVSEREVVGTIGGGHLEWLAIDTARTMLSVSQADEPFEKNYPLGPALGQCCGGAVTLRYSKLDARAARDWPGAAPRFFLQLYGAGHVGRAIVKLLSRIDCRVQWIDDRESEFPADVLLPPHIEKVCVEPVEAEVRIAPAGACYLVLTHCHDLDLRITEAILRRGDFRHLGLIGSQTKRARFLSQMRDAGLTEAMLAKLVCPIGIPGIEGKDPAVIAASTAAQLLMASEGREGLD